MGCDEQLAWVRFVYVTDTEASAWLTYKQTHRQIFTG